MTEEKLKTLKDLDLNYEDILRQEAIKWVKEDIEKFGLFKDGIPEITKKWMERFNLTEDDLK